MIKNALFTTLEIIIIWKGITSFLSQPVFKYQEYYHYIWFILCLYYSEILQLKNAEKQYRRKGYIYRFIRTVPKTRKSRPPIRADRSQNEKATLTISCRSFTKPESHAHNFIPTVPKVSIFSCKSVPCNTFVVRWRLFRLSCKPYSFLCKKQFVSFLANGTVVRYRVMVMATHLIRKRPKQIG